MKWTPEQDEFLEAHANKGAEWCAREMFARFGVLRSREAVWRHAYRIGASMRRYEICPSCGREVMQLKGGSGLCRACHMHELAEKSRELRDGIEKSISEREDEREYERNRKWLQRHYGEIVNLSQRMSQRRSDARN